MSPNIKAEKTFHIEIIETLSQIVEVVADDESSALLKVQALYQNEDMVLNTENHIDTEFNVFE